MTIEATGLLGFYGLELEGGCARGVRVVLAPNLETSGSKTTLNKDGTHEGLGSGGKR